MEPCIEGGKNNVKKFKEGMYYVNTIKPAFISVIGSEDFTDMISDFSKFSYLGVDFNGDYVQLINTPAHGFIIVANPMMDGRFIRLNEILKLKQKKYEVYDGSTRLASVMNLDAVFCLINGYVDTYPNRPLKITIKEIEQCKEGV